jgi:hypothetical protein
MKVGFKSVLYPHNWSPFLPHGHQRRCLSWHPPIICEIVTAAGTETQIFLTRWEKTRVCLRIELFRKNFGHSLFRHHSAILLPGCRLKGTAFKYKFLTINNLKRNIMKATASVLLVMLAQTFANTERLVSLCLMSYAIFCNPIILTSTTICTRQVSSLSVNYCVIYDY